MVNSKIFGYVKTAKIDLDRNKEILANINSFKSVFLVLKGHIVIINWCKDKAEYFLHCKMVVLFLTNVF